MVLEGLIYFLVHIHKSNVWITRTYWGLCIDKGEITNWQSPDLIYRCTLFNTYVPRPGDFSISLDFPLLLEDGKIWQWVCSPWSGEAGGALAALFNSVQPAHSHPNPPVHWDKLFNHKCIKWITVNSVIYVLTELSMRYKLFDQSMWNETLLPLLFFPGFICLIILLVFKVN